MRPFFLGKWTSPGTPPQIAIPTVTPEVQSEVPSENGTASIISCNRLGPEPGAASVLGDKSARGKCDSTASGPSSNVLEGWFRLADKLGCYLDPSALIEEPIMLWL